jgi:hypothetical protein
MLWGIDRSRENRVENIDPFKGVFLRSERMEEMMALSEPVGIGDNLGETE